MRTSILQQGVKELLAILVSFRMHPQERVFNHDGMDGEGNSYLFTCLFIFSTFFTYVVQMIRFMEPLTSKVPMMVIEGNHEIEPQASGVTFKSYLTRFSVPSEESGSQSNFYYSFDAGGIHFIMLGAYIDYNRTSEFPYLSSCTYIDT